MSLLFVLIIITVGQSRWHDFWLFVGLLVIDPMPLESSLFKHKLILSARLHAALVRRVGS